MSAEVPLRSDDPVINFAEQICKARRITAEGVLNIA
jgi:hypothetical protein